MNCSKLIAYLILGITLLSFSACRQEPAFSNPEEINIRLQRDPNKLNPITYPSSVAREVYQYILPPLGDFDPISLELKPILIKAIPKSEVITEGEYKGFIQYTMEFLDEAKWDNGKDITAEDFLFTLKTIRNSEIESGSWRPYFKDIQAVILDPENPKKFSVLFGEPYMLAMEAIVTANLYPKHIYDPNNATDQLDVFGNLKEGVARLDSNFVRDFNGVKHSREVVEGAGPYRLVDWESKQYVVLEKKENYWAGETKNPHLQALPKKLIFKIIPDEVTALTLLQSKELDVLSGISGVNFENEKKNNPDFNYFNPQLIRFYYLMLNNEDPILKDKNVRLALAHLTNVELMMDNLENGLAERQNGLFHASKSYANSELKAPAYDPAKAKILLDDAGWKDSDGDGVRDKVINGIKTDLEVSMTISSSELAKKVSLIFQEGTKEAGIVVKPEPKSGAEIRKDVQAGNFQIYTASVVQDPNDDEAYNRWHSEGTRNYGNYKNERLDALIEECRVTLNREKRVMLYDEMQRIVHEDNPMIFLYSPKERIIASKNLEIQVSSKRPGYMANTFKSNLVAVTN